MGDFGFTLHGLWPDGQGAEWPQYCTPTRLVPEPVIRASLCNTPSVQLIQHEWEKHGTCTGLAAQDYFAKVEQAFRNVHVPEQYPALTHEQQFNVSDLEKSFAEANHAPPDAIRVSCHAGALVSLEVCVDKNLQYQSCTQSVRECPANQVDMLPPQ
jgi:ribonuclease T2